MGYQNAYSAYRETSIKTANGGRLIIMLYEEAVRRLKEASESFNTSGKVSASLIERFNANIQKTHAIITELQVSLNMKEGGDIAQNLMALYIFFNEELMDASINQKKEKIDFVKDMMLQLLEAWRETVSSTPQQTQPIRPALNIQG